MDPHKYFHKYLPNEKDIKIVFNGKINILKIKFICT